MTIIPDSRFLAAESSFRSLWSLKHTFLPTNVIVVIVVTVVTVLTIVTVVTVVIIVTIGTVVTVVRVVEVAKQIFFHQLTFFTNFFFFLQKKVFHHKLFSPEKNHQFYPP